MARQPRLVRLWTVALTMLGVAVVASTFGDYGVTWDEPVQSHYGEGVLRYFASGLSDSSIDEFLHMRFYGPLFELAAALAYSGAPAAKYEIRHLLIGLTGLATVLGVLRFGTRLPGRWVVLFAPIALIALPRFYGHAFNNSKDIPFACAFVWALYATWRFATSGGEREDGATPEPERREGFGPAVVCGLALGATLAIRPGGLPLLGLLFGVLLGWRVLARGEHRAPEIGHLAGRVATAWAVAWLVMVALWPWAHENPLLNPVHAVIAALSFPDTFPVLFEGEITRSDALPRYYLAKYLLITTPPSLLVLAAGGAVVAVREGWRSPRAPSSAGLLAVVCWLLVPLLLATVGRPNVYDGMRHLLFALPALALLAGLGASALTDTLLGLLNRRSTSKRAIGVGLPAAVATGVALVLASPAVEHVRLHPYQSTYFNAFVGGTAGADGRYETDYWISSYKEAIEWVNARAATSGREITVLVAADPYSNDCAAHFLGPGVRMARTAEQGLAGEVPEPFDYYLATTRYGLHGNFPDSKVAHRVGREGATFAVIRARASAERSLAGS
jgi:hypothetical protein